LIEGNHERRLSTLVQANAQAAFGLRRANTPGDWPVLSAASLLRLDELDIRWVPGYPAGRVWLRTDVMAHHGKAVSAARAARDPITVSTLQGHDHRFSVQTRTMLGRSGHPVHTIHVTCGTLARTDGYVPSFHGSTDDSGVPVTAHEDWQQGVVVLTMDDEPGDLPAVELVPIHRQGQFRRQTGPIQDEGGGRQLNAGFHAITGQIGVGEILDALVGRAAVIPQQTAMLTVIAQQVLGHVEEIISPLPGHRLAGGGELQVDLADAFDPLRAEGARGDGRGRAGACAGDVVVHTLSLLE
jgi:hypothetical protein